MHTSAMKRMGWFVDNYVPKDKLTSVLDIGSYNVNGCFKSLFSNRNCIYTGLDVVKGPNVDIVVADPYNWKEVGNNYFDFIISGSAFEHIEYPWLTMQQIHKKLKPNGICCILTPFNLKEHRYPTDCYRYYPDGMIALAKYAGLTVIDCTTGGYPEGVDIKTWIHSQNYDDTVLIASKICFEEDKQNLETFPKLSRENRSKIIY